MYTAMALVALTAGVASSDLAPTGKPMAEGILFQNDLKIVIELNPTSGEVKGATITGTVAAPPSNCNPAPASVYGLSTGCHKGRSHCGLLGRCGLLNGCGRKASCNLVCHSAPTCHSVPTCHSAPTCHTTSACGGQRSGCGLFGLKSGCGWGHRGGGCR